MSAPVVRPGILDIAAYVPGKSKLAGKKKVIKLASNEGALGPSASAVAAYKRAMKDMDRYPDGGCVSLREAIGRRHGLDPARIVCGAGSDEVLVNLARAYAGPGDEVLMTYHCFNMYPLFALSVGATPAIVPEKNLTADVDALLSRVTAKTRMVYLANPNNPTGTYISADELKRLRAGLREDIVLVIDSAYAEYVIKNDYSDGAALVDEGVNTVMTRTFSKIHGLAALRIGWAYCPGPVFGAIDRLRSPFGVSMPAQMAGAASMDDGAHLDAARDHNAAWLPWMRDRLAALGLEVTPSAANFLLVRFPDAQAANAQLNKCGIIVREMGVYHLPDWLRITIGRGDEMKVCAEAIEDFMAP
jgi:histidinol-phosphate aminotransferase